MTTTQLRRIIREEIISQKNNQVYDNSINEGIIDAISKIKSLAKNYATKYSQQAAKHIKVDKLVSDKPNIPNMVTKAKTDLEKKLKIDEASGDYTKVKTDAFLNKWGKLIPAAWVSGTVGFGYLGAYLETTFNYWFKTVIENQAAQQVAIIMADELRWAGTYGKLAAIGIGIFFIFFVIYAYAEVIFKKIYKNR